MNSLPTRAEKPCVDCKWFQWPHPMQRDPECRCRHPKTWRPNVVLGSAQWNNSPHELREFATCCGPNGVWYEPRFMVKVENFLRRELPV